MRKLIKSDPKIGPGRDSPLRNWVEDNLNEGELNGVLYAANLLQAGKKNGDPKETTLNLIVPALKKTQKRSLPPFNDWDSIPNTNGWDESVNMKNNYWNHGV
jgi:hypothetical protein